MRRRLIEQRVSLLVAGRPTDELAALEREVDSGDVVAEPNVEVDYQSGSDDLAQRIGGFEGGMDWSVTSPVATTSAYCDRTNPLFSNDEKSLPRWMVSLRL